MADVLEMIRSLKDRLWAEYGDALSREKSQDEVHMTYYIGDLLERRGHKWFSHEGSAAYTEKAMHDAFIAGLRIGKREADQIATRIVKERIADAHAALDGEAA